MSRSDDLRKAKENKADEFYTQLIDIEKELRYYKDKFEGKIVLCNCDDPYESNFFKFFTLNFNQYKLKKLICTCYDSSPIIGEQLSLFELNYEIPNRNKKAYRIEINEVPDSNGDGAIDLTDIEYLIKNKKNVLKQLNGDGDFRSEECLDFLKEADIVVTNPPFSLFREFIDILMKYKKKFLIIGNQNAITYKEFFPLIMNNEVWMGASIHNGDREFRVPNDYNVSKNYRYDENGNKYVRVRGPRWWTNLDYSQRHEDIILYKSFDEKQFPKYDNYDAINVDNTSDIPVNYYGVIGVPITFLDKYNPDQFKIVGFSQGDLFIECGGKGASQKFVDDYYKNGGTGSIKEGWKHVVYYENGKPVVPYQRIFVQLLEKDSD